jgi:dipeptidase E
MNLYLSSFLVGTEASRLSSLVHVRKAVVIANALDNMSALRKEHLQGQLEELHTLGFEIAELDLRECFGAPDRLARRLADIGLIWVTGGNSFLLRRAMRYSGFDRYIGARKRDESLVYGGYSAGACVAGPTLRGVECVDLPHASAEGYETEVIWDGLGLIPHSIAPHYQSQHRDSSGAQAMVEYFIDHKIPFVALRDGEVLVTRATASG